MNLEKEQILRNMFPKFFDHFSFGFECGDGWFELIKDLFQNIRDIINKLELDEDVFIYATQVKEKYGGLRVYISFETDAITKLIIEAEEKSLKICELCGNPGKINDGPWYEVRCMECNKIDKNKIQPIEEIMPNLMKNLAES